MTIDQQAIDYFLETKHPNGYLFMQEHPCKECGKKTNSVFYRKQKIYTDELFLQECRACGFSYQLLKVNGVLI